MLGLDTKSITAKLFPVPSNDDAHPYPHVSDTRFIFDFVAHSFHHAPHIRNERGALLEILSLVRSDVYHGVDVPHGDGRNVMVIPGFIAGDWTHVFINGWLRKVGHTPYPSGIVSNVFLGERFMPDLMDRIKRQNDLTGRPSTLIGHSLGGSLAKLVSDRIPDEVDLVIGLAAVFNSHIGVSPVFFAASLPIFALDLELFGPKAMGVEIRLLQELDEPAKVPHVALYTPNDGVLSYKACMRDDAENIPVKSTHMGMIWNQESFRVLADLLHDRPSKHLARLKAVA